MFGFVVVIEITAEDGEQTQRIALALWAVPEVAGHFDAVLGHDEFVDFLSLPQFFFEQLSVFMDFGFLGFGTAEEETMPDFMSIKSRTPAGTVLV